MQSTGLQPEIIARENEPSDAGRVDEVVLRCPRCAGPVMRLQCMDCSFQMKVQNGIVYALPPERAERYVRFISEYEQIRSAEGRGSAGDDYYLGLPYTDATGRNSRQWKIRARSYDFFVRRILEREFHDEEKILDLGAGNCWMSFRLAKLGYSPWAVDLLTNDGDGLGAGKLYHSYLSAPFPRFRAEISHLPFADAQFDIAIFNASFHYAEDCEATLREVLRCLKEDGILIISDTPWYSHEASGRQMVAERRMAFQRRFGTPSDAIQSLEFLTDERLHRLEQKLSIHWRVYRPWYGWAWAMRPWMARLKRRREPSRFRVYVARKHAYAR